MHLLLLFTGMVFFRSLRLRAFTDKYVTVLYVLALYCFYFVKIFDRALFSTLFLSLTDPRQ